MMKPKIDDVIEYVKAGEDDRQMEKMLDLHPDGQEFLKQARFICRMLQDQAESKDTGGLAAGFGSAKLESPVAMHSAESMLVRDELTFYQEAPLRRRAKRSPSIGDMIEGEGQRSEDLGTLEFVVEVDQVVLSYEPSEAVVRRRARQSRAPKVAATQMDFEGILIHGRGYMVSVPDTLAGDESVTIRVTRNTNNLPVKNLGLIFMPDSGPFMRVETDSEGRAELPLPAQSGTLRIESGIPHHLHIKLKT